jgi:hypothetical protein
MSLAMFAAQIDDNTNITLPNNSDSSDNILNQKRHKKTQRKYPKIADFNPDKVNSVLQRIHNTTEDDDDDDKPMFNPPPKPESMYGAKITPTTESFGPLAKTVGKAPSPSYDSGEKNYELNDYSNYGDSKSAEEYYKTVMPGYATQKNPVNVPHYAYKDKPSYDYQSPDVLMQKLNYVISLLEDQQDEKTNNVTEEVILYSFLGIFIIFMADTFVRAGKYTR